jgi:hypothetical protein
VSLIAAVRDLFNRQATSLAALERRVAALEARPLGVRYAGIWDADLDYQKDEAVTYRGSLFVALASSSNVKPEGAEGVWRLAVKRGRDGRDGRDAR